MQTKLIAAAKQGQFDNVFANEIKKGKKEWEIAFADSINCADCFSFTSSFWYIGDFFTSKIVKVGGAFETESSLSKKNWEGMAPANIGKLFHPDDLPKMEAFLVFMATFLSKKTAKQRSNIKFSKLFRMQNKNKSFTWRLMEFPEIYYENNRPRYVFCKISNYEHILFNAKCTMYVLDKNTKKKTLYYCENREVVLQPYIYDKHLSDREIQVIKLLCKGLLSKEIAEILKISKNTVENHKQNIFIKTKTKKITELVMFANNYLNFN